MASNQELLVSLLKQKGTGKTMSKSLNQSQLTLLSDLILCSDTSSATVSTLLTAFMMLPNNHDELSWLDHLKTNLYPFLLLM